MPDLNTRLFRKVHDQIVADPESHNQADFETRSQCGVTRCIAGWAILIDAHDKGDNVVSFLNSSAFLRSRVSPSSFARELLGLTLDESEYLFFEADDEEAVEVVRACAEGVRPAVPGGV